MCLLVWWWVRKVERSFFEASSPGSVARLMLSLGWSGFFPLFYSSPSPHPHGELQSPGGLAATYWTNPQFKIHLEEVDEDQEEGTGEPCCTVLLGLMQKNRRRQKRIGQGTLSIGYAVYQVLPSWAPPSLCVPHVFALNNWSTSFLIAWIFLITCCSSPNSSLKDFPEVWIPQLETYSYGSNVYC
jgi:hypothetical protein